MSKLILVLVFLVYGVLNATTAEQDFKQLVKDFVPAYQALKVPELDYSYVENLKKIQTLEGISAQKKVIAHYQRLLRKIDEENLSKPLRLQYEELKFQLNLETERLLLEEDFRNQDPQTIPENGLYHLRNGKRWYRYFLAKWTTLSPHPLKLLLFGKSEVARVREEMRKIQKELGFEGKDKEFYEHLNSEAFVYTDEKKLVEDFKSLRTHLKANLQAQFETLEFQEVDIQPIPNVTKDSPPGYYTKNIFHYNFYQNRFPKRALEWLFIHEAIPGHHYQQSISPAASSLKDVFRYFGFSEGWAVYTEDIGRDLSAYQDPYMHYGKWEWDLVRSARVVLDVGINYYGWSRERAFKYWKENVPNQDAIAEREINRITNWPLQIHTYKLGERKFLQMKEKAQNKEGFDIKKFHTQIIQYGDMPLGLLDLLID